MNNFDKVKSYLLNLGYDIKSEDPQEELFIISDEEEGLLNVVVDCEDPILIVEMHLIDLKNEKPEFYRTLLEKNRNFVHGAFVIDAEGNRLLYRDTLELENLDENELEGTLNALKLVIGENYGMLLDYAQN
ncbi:MULTISPECIES: CesT family type III secretion system chaperone [Flammeovirga]|uniref:YbjN domain-containing protein n=1 Tax=Flammeovirga agarivorans TaxID=2726742 RepID=A0A7X8SHW9_9BACT|nr:MULTISPECIES: CesT family type III secretion system chaperone [Flammeovirga]NLR90564.1 YbjN domain-containing protein [Flammeovirga agarivorans]